MSLALKNKNSVVLKCRNLEILALRAEKYRKKKQLCSAKYICEHILSLSPYHLKALTTLGRVFLEEKNTSQALQTFEIILLKPPQNLFLLKEMASCFLKEKKYKKTLLIFNKILELDPLCTKTRKEKQKIETRHIREKKLKDLDESIKEQNFLKAEQLIKDLETDGFCPELSQRRLLFIKKFKQFMQEKKIKTLKQLIQRVEQRSEFVRNG